MRLKLSIFTLITRVCSAAPSVGRSCKSGRAFRVGFGPKVDKNLGLTRAWDVLFVLGVQKYNKNNLETLLNFLDLT